MAPPQRARLVVRWASALPVKQAMLRRLLNHRASITGDAERLLEQDDPFYRVAVVGVPLEVTQAVGSLRALREATALRRKSLGSIGSVDVRFAYDDDLPTLEFRFPRSEAITLRDREVEFITEFGEARLSATFKLKEMVVGGRLTL